MNELQLQTGAYKTTFIGTEIIRESTEQEWQTYGEILRRVDEAKQWAIGDWLVDGKRHYGDGLYERAAGLLGVHISTLKNLKGLSEKFEMSRRHDLLPWGHHYEVASIKSIEEGNGKLKLSDKRDKEKMQELLGSAEKLLGVDRSQLMKLKSISERYEILLRSKEPPGIKTNCRPI